MDILRNETEKAYSQADQTRVTAEEEAMQQQQ